MRGQEEESGNSALSSRNSMCEVKGACSGAKNFAEVSCCGCRGVKIGMCGPPWEKGAGEGGSPVLSLL